MNHCIIYKNHSKSIFILIRPVSDMKIKIITVPLLLLNKMINIVKSGNTPGVDYKIQHNGVLKTGYMPFPKNEKLLEQDDASSSYTFPTGISFTFMGQSYSSITVEENGVAHFGGNSMLGYLQQEIPLDKRIPALMPYSDGHQKIRALKTIFN